jgi:phage gp37-like protein
MHLLPDMQPLCKSTSFYSITANRRVYSSNSSSNNIVASKQAGLARKVAPAAGYAARVRALWLEHQQQQDMQRPLPCSRQQQQHEVATNSTYAGWRKHHGNRSSRSPVESHTNPTINKSLSKP